MFIQFCLSISIKLKQILKKIRKTHLSLKEKRKEKERKKTMSVATLPITSVNNKTKYNMEDVPKDYSVGNIIYYSGTCYDFSNFYARIDNITPTSMDFTILELEYDGDNIHFYETDSKLTRLTRRPFYVINKIYQI